MNEERGGEKKNIYFFNLITFLFPIGIRVYAARDLPPGSNFLSFRLFLSLFIFPFS
jgi:hypothetical protein